MRWTQPGAESLLNLRCVSENGDFEAYHAYLRAKRRCNVNGVVGAQGEPAPSGATLEDVARSSVRDIHLRLAA